MLDKLPIEVIRNLVLEYRISIDTLCSLSSLSKEEMYKKLLAVRDNELLRGALIYVLDVETKNDKLIDQKVAKRKLLVFETLMFKAKTKEEKIKLLKDLSKEDEIKRLKKTKYEDMTKEDMEFATKYRYKYVLSRQYIEDVFGIKKHAQEHFESTLDQDFIEKLKVMHEYNVQKRFFSTPYRKR